MIDVAIAREDGGIRTMLELCAQARSCFEFLPEG
jgi:hypothetical protein